MSPAQIADLLAFAGGYGVPDPDQATLDAWHHALHQIDYDDAFGAIVEHYRESPALVTPADIWNRCRVPEAPAPAPKPAARRDPDRWHRMWEAALAEQAAACESNRALVLGCKPPEGSEDAPLAARLMAEPLGYAYPAQWSGYIPPELWNGERNNSPRRAALLAITEDALAASTAGAQGRNPR